VDVLFFEYEISNVLIKVLCGTFATKIYWVLHQGRCGPAAYGIEFTWFRLNFIFSFLFLF